MTGGKLGGVPRTRILGPRAGWKPSSVSPEIPKKILTPDQVTSGLNRGHITDAIMSAIKSQADPKLSEELRKVLKDFDARPGVTKALEQIEARLVKKFENRRVRASKGLTFDILLEESLHIADLASIFFERGLALPCASVYMALLKTGEAWITKPYKSHEVGSSKFHTWAERLIEAVTMLNSKNHGARLLSFKKKLTYIVNGKARGYGVDLRGPLEEARNAIGDILEGKVYTCLACRECKRTGEWSTLKCCTPACDARLLSAEGYGEDETPGPIEDGEVSEEDGDLDSARGKAQDEPIDESPSSVSKKTTGLDLQQPAEEILPVPKQTPDDLQPDEMGETETVLVRDVKEGPKKISDLDLQPTRVSEIFGLAVLIQGDEFPKEAHLASLEGGNSALDSLPDVAKLVAKQSGKRQYPELPNVPPADQMVWPWEEKRRKPNSSFPERMVMQTEGVESSQYSSNVVHRMPPAQLPLPGEPKLQIKIPGKKPPERTLNSFWGSQRIKAK